MDFETILKKCFQFGYLMSNGKMSKLKKSDLKIKKLKEIFFLKAPPLLVMLCIIICITDNV